MTPDEAVAVVESISYKPNWKIMATHNVDQFAVVMCVMHKAEDTYHPGVEIPVVLTKTLHNLSLERSHGEDFLLEEVHRMIREVELHELDEWFKYKGQRIYDPHNTRNGD